jgi:hypothetical protein
MPSFLRSAKVELEECILSTANDGEVKRTEFMGHLQVALLLARFITCIRNVMNLDCCTKRISMIVLGLRAGRMVPSPYDRCRT